MVAHQGCRATPGNRHESLWDAERATQHRGNSAAHTPAEGELYILRDESLTATAVAESAHRQPNYWALDWGMGSVCC